MGEVIMENTNKVNDDDIAKLIKSWKVVSAFVVAMSIGFYLFTQGSHATIFNVALEETTSPYSAAVYGLIFLIPLLVFYYSYAAYVSDILNETVWFEKLPLIFDVHLPKKNKLQIRMKKISMVLVIVVPMFSVGHCFLKSIESTIYFNDHCSETGGCKKVFSKGAYESFTKFTPFKEIFINGNGYRLDGQITYFPGWQAWLSLFLVLFVLVRWLYLVKKIIIKGQIKGDGAS